jgi:hypothetical protein
VTIKIEDLDEFEGLTADMVRAWMRANGWEPIGGQYGVGPVWALGNGKRISDSRILTDDGLKWLALVSKVSAQSLLREINPRMRAGWPTDEELERHAFWMVRTPSDDGIRVLGAYVAREWKRAGITVECWPCDQHGNKTRRGA